MKLLKFCEDHGFKTWTKGSKYCSSGHVQIDCPFCDNSKGPHMGWHLSKHYFNCWSCGWQSTVNVVMSLLSVDYPEAKQIIFRYRGKEKDFYQYEEDFDRPSKCEVPGKSELLQMHIDYLKSRNLDPVELQSIYDLRGTGYAGAYKFRIIAPIYYRGRIVSFQGRDVTNKQDLRWKACQKNNEVLDHQKLLYGYDDTHTESAILVEGASDVWNMSIGSIGGFGMGISKEQIKLLKKYEKLFILFDQEPVAQRNAQELAKILATTGQKAYNIRLDTDKDPAELSKQEKRDIKKELLGIL